MSVKPVDFQVMIPKMAEVSKIHNDEHARNLALQQQQTNSLQNKVESSLKQVYSREKVQEAKVREKHERNSSRGREERGKDRDKKDKNKRSGTGFKTRTIDIKI